MKAKLMAVFAAALLFATLSANAADACPNAAVLNGSGSPPTVTGSVQLAVGGYVDQQHYIYFYLDNVLQVVWAPEVPPGYHHLAVLSLSLPVGSHTVQALHDPSCVVSFSVVPPPPPASAPTLSVHPMSPTRVSWQPITHATGYEVQRDGQTVATTSGTVYVLFDLQECESAMVRVRAFNAAGYGPWSSWQYMYVPPSGPFCNQS